MNCPGATAGPSPMAGSSVSVQVSAVLRSRVETTNGTGVSAPGCGGSVRVAVAIDVEQSEACPLQAFDQHLREAAHQVVAQRRIVVALLAQAGAVERSGTDGGQRARVEMPAVGGKEPRPADHLAGLD